MSFADYIRHGWQICAIERHKKAPTYERWNTKPIPLDAADGIDGAGLLHALSGTCALDIDDMALARPWLSVRGIDVDALLDADNAVQISSGRAGRAKLLYAMKRPLRTLKPKGSGVELRCATAEGRSAQDVLPETIHPDTGKPYEWAGGLLGDWRKLPTIPAPLLALWRELAEPITEAIDPPAEKPTIDLAKLRKAAFRHSADCEYPEWIAVGMKLHDGTGGAQEGFDIWCEWSKGFKRKPYPGDDKLLVHWKSFNSEGKNAVTGAALVGELPAEAEDFEIIDTDDASAEPPPSDKTAERKAALDKLIDRFVFVILDQEYFDTSRNALIGDKAIRHLLTPYMPRKSGREIDPIDRLMRSKEKASVEAMAFHPGEDAIFTHEGRRYANTYFPASIPAPLEPTAEELEKIEWLFSRINDEFFRNWLKQFYAHMVQRPEIKIRSAPLIWSGTEGNGKSTIAHTIPKLLAGSDYYIGVNQSALHSDFNDYLIGKWVVALTEFRANSRGDRIAISKKTEEWIADDMLTLTVKGSRGYSVPNHLIITASTNSDDAAQIDENNRKWAVHRLDAPSMTEAEKAWIFEGFLRTPRARGVLRHYFLNWHITDFSPNADAPKTKDRHAMIESSMPLDLEMLITAWEQRSEPMSREVVITNDVGDYVRKNCPAKPSNDRIGKLLCGPPFNGVRIQFRYGEARYRAIVLRGWWASASGKDIMAYINDETVDLAS